MLAIVLANLADLCTFLLVARIAPIAGEANPLVAPLYEVTPLMVALLKIGGVCAALLILPRLPRLRRIGYVAAVAVPVLGVLSNTVSGLLV